MRVELENVWHSFRHGERVLKEVSLTVEAGEIVAVIGPSGSGKSTLLSIAGLVTRPSGGTVRYDGREVKTRDSAILLGSRVAWLFQSNNVFGERTATDNVALGLLATGQRWKAARKRADVALEMVGLGGRGEDSVTVLSGGEAQRVGVARVLAQEPELLLCDEPTAQLDRSNSEAVFAALAAIRTMSSAVVIATHDLQVRAIADRVLDLRDGTLRQAS